MPLQVELGQPSTSKRCRWLFVSVEPAEEPQAPQVTQLMSPYDLNVSKSPNVFVQSELTEMLDIAQGCALPATVHSYRSHWQ